MIGLDANVLVRFATGDDPGQSEQATRLAGGLTPDRPGYVSIITTVELIWVLRRTYRMNRDQVTEGILKLLGAVQLVFEDADDVAAALRLAEEANCDPADALIMLRCSRAGCSATATLDRRAAALPGMRLLADPP
ncbi:MAG: type II toxin-antitoxin system VapC family toxin [Bifidobacteriaceae bacterium]|jgi:predicted nucleic-acid-binding protein|nr:type II toxin-antitoxin system VapC family toxin [Bifidobacteriaceae bacterium]